MPGEIEKNWNLMAEAYEAFTENLQSYSYSIEWPCIQTMLPPLGGKKVLDLGGGTGRFALLFAQDGPRCIDVVDNSEQMLSIGRQKAEKSKVQITFAKGDINSFDGFVEEDYDFIFSSTAFHYLADLQPVFNSIYRLLKRGGKAVISVIHPIYTAQYPLDKEGEFPSDEEWKVQYLDFTKRAYVQPWIEFNPAIENYLSTSYHHTFGGYINAIIQSGFVIDRIEEPLPPAEWKLTNEKRYEGCMATPTFLIIAISKK